MFSFVILTTFKEKNIFMENTEKYMYDIGLRLHNINISESFPIRFDNLEDSPIYQYIVNLGSHDKAQITTRFDFETEYYPQDFFIEELEGSIEESIRKKIKTSGKADGWKSITDESNN